MNVKLVDMSNLVDISVRNIKAEIVPGIITDRPVLPSIYFGSEESVHEDVTNLVDRVLKQTRTDFDTVNGVIANGSINSLTLAYSAYFYLRKLRNQETQFIDYGEDKELRGVKGCGSYMIISDNLLDGDVNRGIVRLLKERRANPLAVAALIDRRKQQGPIENVPVFVFRDLSSNTVYTATEGNTYSGPITTSLRVM